MPRSEAFLFIILSAVLLAVPQVSLANTNRQYQAILPIIEQQQLWLDPEWLNLVHYEKDSTASGYSSQVDAARFFNASTGKHDPQAELKASIEAFYREDIYGDEHAQCRFVARLEWLKTMLPESFTDLPAVECKQYREWRERIPDQQLTMVFPAYHLNSPSSMFG
ncbi:MAG: hypothetical protein EP315_00320, partial [Gammaproteobacteria bacterium]